MSTNRPFIRIAATYPITESARLPITVEVELDVDDVAPEEEPQPLDGDEFPTGGFTRFVTEVVRALRGGATTAKDVHVYAFASGDIEKLAGLGEHVPGCDGTCDQPSAAGEPASPAPAAEDLPDAAPVDVPAPQAADHEHTSPRVPVQSERDTISAYPTAAGEKGGA